MLPRIIVGLPLATSLRAVLIAATNSAAVVAVRNLATGHQHVAREVTRPASPEMAAALAARGWRPRAFVAEALTPGAEYAWIVNGTETARRVRTLPEKMPVAGLSIVVGSCLFGYTAGPPAAYAASVRVVALAERPAFRLAIGDNVYVDIGPDQADRTDAYPETVERYEHALVTSAAADAWEALPTGTTWDDHEFWNDYPESQIHLSRSRPPLRDAYEAAAREAIDLMQVPLNPPPVCPGGRSYTFDIDPLRFFVADIRSQRTLAAAATPGFMPPEEFTALCKWLRSASPGPRVLVMGQPLYTKDVVRILGFYSTDHNLPAFRSQYAGLLTALRESPSDVLVVAGDVHFSRAMKLEFPGGRAVYEFISSPIAHVPTTVSIIGRFGDLGRYSQDDSRVEVGAPPGNGGLRPTMWFFGSGAPQSFGVLRFKAVGTGVEVGGGFLDAAAAQWRWLRDERPRDAPPAALKDVPCGCDRTFVLRDR